VNETTAAVCGMFVLMVPLAAAGIALINAGLGRSRNAAHVMTSSLCAFAIAGLVYFAIGFGIQSHPGFAGPSALMGGKPWSWIGRGPFFFRGLKFDELSAVTLIAWLQIATVGLGAVIPLGGGGERWRLGSICSSTVAFSALIYPLFAHWTWGGGWLSQIGANYGMGRGYMDAGGSGVIQCTAGLTALGVTWTLGPRRGKFGMDGMPSAIPGHNIVVVLFGCLLAMAGWLCLNEAGGILYAGATLAAIPLIAINTLLGAGSGLLAAAAVTWLRFGKPDASLSANGWVAGLVASSASCAFVKPAEEVIIGLIAGALVVYSIELLELRLGVDDPGGTVSVHAIGGLWGVLAMGLFGRYGSAQEGQGQMIAQVIGIATLLGFVFPLTYGVNWLLNRVSPFRVSPEGEWQGLDLYELGAGAYPEFVSHGEEFTPR
jgi:Amt family ammonium transporter